MLARSLGITNLLYAYTWAGLGLYVTVRRCFGRALRGLTLSRWLVSPYPTVYLSLTHLYAAVTSLPESYHFRMSHQAVSETAGAAVVVG